MSRDDELAETAAADTPALAVTAPEIGATLGRYRVLRELGAGGMGVVYEAFDPELERRVALKVLKLSADLGDDARQRLLREARAMARVKHPNVVTVYEVGSDRGHDFVAMELVEGEALADWLRAHRSRREIVGTFVAAGRGLAAAHAAGLVHRDFKPHNVLRSRDGRVLVTDFGLARGVEAAAPASGGTSALSGLTETGAFMGTPAYMAPEQWRGGEVGPSADQFAFCVALWEALAGERPFRGATLEELRGAIERGAGSLDAARLPRALRAPLLRGLAADPAARWPKIDALLGKLDRRGSRARLATGAGFALVAAAAVLAFAMRTGAAAETCTPPIERVLADTHGRAELARDALAGYGLYVATCKAPASPHRAAVIACLDGVRARGDAIGQSAERLGPQLAIDVVASEAVDPAVCDRDDPPHLRIAATPRVVDALVKANDSRASADDMLAFARGADDACAAALALVMVANNMEASPDQRSVTANAVDAAERCGDERTLGDALLARVGAFEAGPTVGADVMPALERARNAVAHIPDPILVGWLAVRESAFAALRGRIDDALRFANAALDPFAKRGVQSAERQLLLAVTDLRLDRGRPDDLAAVHADHARWRGIALASGDTAWVTMLDRQDAVARFGEGDDRGVADALVRAWSAEGATVRTITGTVLDPDGRPAPGAFVVAGRHIIADSHTVWFPLLDGEGEQRTTHADAHGHYSLALASADDLVIAQLGALRSLAVHAADRTDLALRATRAVDGHLALGEIASTRVLVWIGARDTAPDETGRPSYEVVVPLAFDGTFHAAGLPTTELAMTARVAHDDSTSDVLEKNAVVPAGPAAAHVELALATGDRSTVVLVRSMLMTKLDGAQVTLLPGEVTIRGVDDLIAAARGAGCRTALARPASELSGLPADKRQADDLALRFDHLGAGRYTVCAVGLNGDLSDRAFTRMLWAHAHELQVACVKFSSDAGIVIVEAPPQKRFAD